MIRWPEREPVRCYVYAICTRGRVYIGKGTGKRYRCHIDEAVEHALIRRIDSYYNRLKLSVLAKAIANGDLIIVSIVRDGMTDAEAFALEKLEVAKVPRRRRMNLTEGGEGFDSETSRRGALASNGRGGRIAMSRHAARISEAGLAKQRELKKDGMWREALGRRIGAGRWGGVQSADRSAQMSDVNRKAWSKLTAEQRSKRAAAASATKRSRWPPEEKEMRERRAARMAARRRAVSLVTTSR